MLLQFWLKGNVCAVLSAREAPYGRTASKTAAAARTRETRARAGRNDEDMRPPEGALICSGQEREEARMIAEPSCLGEVTAR